MLPSGVDLQYFLEVASIGNISRAAERLGISQPTLTQSIRKLEAKLGALLFIREKKGVVLTAAGRRTVQRSRELLDLWSQLRSEALRDETEIRGHFTVGCHASVARYTLSQALRTLLQKQPGLRFTLVHDLSRRITEGVISRKVDIGIVINPVAHPELVIKPVGADTFALWANKKKRVSDALICDPDLLQTQWLLPKLARAGVHISQTIPCQSLDVIASLTRGGAGYGLLPGRVAGMEGPELSKVDPDLPEFRDQISLIYRSDVRRTNAAKLVIAHLSDCLVSHGRLARKLETVTDSDALMPDASFSRRR